MLQIRQGVVEFMPHSFALVNKASARFKDVERRFNYTTPKTFLELIKLYKNVLRSKREKTNTNIDRLETGLTKLHKTQKDVDVLVEAAKRMAIQVSTFCHAYACGHFAATNCSSQLLVGFCRPEQAHVDHTVAAPCKIFQEASAEGLVCAAQVQEKVVSADAFAEKVGFEKVKVNAENEAAQIEKEKCEAIAVAVTEKQASCEKDLAAAQPLVEQVRCPPPPPPWRLLW